MIKINNASPQTIVVNSSEKLQKIHTENLQYQLIAVEPAVGFQNLTISNLDNQSIKISNACSVVSDEYPIYSGKYEAIPKKESQIIPTAGKVLLDDFMVKGIPVTRVTNSSGGITVVIGG